MTQRDVLGKTRFSTAKFRVSRGTSQLTSMYGCRNLSAGTPPLAMILNPRLAGFTAQLPSCPERKRTHIREEQLFVIAREHFDRLPQRQPLHSLDVVHRLAHRTTAGSHVPKLYDLDPALYRIEHGAKKTVDRNLMSSFLQYFSFGASKRGLTWIELALWQHPRLVPSQSHDRDAGAGAFA